MINLKNSTYNAKNGRYFLGGLTETSSFALEWWDMKQMNRDDSDITYVMEAKYEGRLDMLGLLFYGDTGLWWVIGQYNGITDPLAELVQGKVLQIPLKERVQADLFSQKSQLGGVPSTRVK
jgi:hypothetical protein